MTDVAPKLVNILLGSALSIVNAGLFLGEFYLALRVTRALKFGELIAGKAAWLARFLLAMVLTNLAFSGLNSQISRYLNGLLGNNVPLTKILLVAEAGVFFYVLYTWFRRAED